MAYSASIEQLLRIMREACPEECDWLTKERSTVEKGLLSVGIKLHLLTIPDGFEPLIFNLGGRYAVRNMYRKSEAEYCIVLPPVGSAEAAICLLECIGNYTDTDIFYNPNIHIQVCSPGRLDARRAAMLAVAFFLTSDTLRLYELQQFLTTASFDDVYKRGRRMVIYDAANLGGFERNFEWWRRESAGDLCVVPELPFKETARTDLIIGPASPSDIENVNLIATLLVHAQFEAHHGYWRGLGTAFEEELSAMLEQHLLSGILAAPWVHRGEILDVGGDQEFFTALQELMDCAFDDAERLADYRAIPRQVHVGPPPAGILSNAVEIVELFRLMLEERATAAPYGEIP